MQVVCEATQSPSSDVQVAAFECLVRIMHLYYDWMKFYMERALFGVSFPSVPCFKRGVAHPCSQSQLTVLGMKHADEQVALQAVEFWSTVCDEEIELALEAEEAAEFSEAPERESSHFARVALPEVLPVLLLLLTKQEEDASDDEWNVSMAAGTCLALLAQCVGDGIVTPIIPFVEGNIKSPEWRSREAAVMAFGSILDGPEEKILAPLVAQALPTLIEMMRDPSLHVRDTTAWTLGRISDVLVKTIKVDTHLPSLVGALVGGLDESPRIVSNCCWSIMNLAEQLGDADADTTPLSPYYDGIVAALMRLAEKCVLVDSLPGEPSSPRTVLPSQGHKRVQLSNFRV
jgi:importin subunit beta-1